MASESARYEPAAPLPAHRAFVVHFSGHGRGRRRFAGRVEHLASGTFTHFGSLRDLLAFFGRVLDEPRDP
jgi:hypothetical protein